METMRQLYDVHKDEKEFISLSKEARQELEKLFVADQVDMQSSKDSGWEQSS